MISRIMIRSSKDSLQSQVVKIARDNDEYLGQAIRIHGDAFLTIHLLVAPNDRIPPETRKLAIDRFALKTVTAKDGSRPRGRTSSRLSSPSRKRPRRSDSRTCTWTRTESAAGSRSWPDMAIRISPSS